MTRGGKRAGAGRPVGSGRHGQVVVSVKVPPDMVTNILHYVHNAQYALPLYSCHISAGFPSPADDHFDRSLNLHEHLIDNPAATFFLRASGDSMVGAGIHDGDLLIVDRSIQPRSGKIVVAAIDGDLTVKRLRIAADGQWLVPENEHHRPIPINNANDVVIWGVVTNVIHAL